MPTKRKQKPNPVPKQPDQSDPTYHATPFGEYFQQLSELDGDWKKSDEYGSFLILSIVEEVGEMARAYLAKHGRKSSNVAAQEDETYQQELGDIILTILRFARIKNINLDERIQYSLSKIKQRRVAPKTTKITTTTTA